MFDDLTLHGRRCSIRKRSLTKQQHALRGKTENERIRKRAQLGVQGWFVNFKQFNQEVRSGCFRRQGGLDEWKGRGGGLLR